MNNNINIDDIKFIQNLWNIHSIVNIFEIIDIFTQNENPSNIITKWLNLINDLSEEDLQMLNNKLNEINDYLNDK